MSGDDWTGARLTPGAAHTSFHARRSGSLSGSIIRPHEEIEKSITAAIATTGPIPVRAWLCTDGDIHREVSVSGYPPASMGLKDRWNDGSIGRWLRHEGQWTLIAFVLFLALIGLLHLTRGTTTRTVRGLSADGGSPIAVGDPQFPLNVALLTGGWTLPGNRVEIALNGDGTYERLFADLRGARASITVQIYYGQSGKLSTILGQILIERAKAGVQVLVLYDA